MILAFAGLTFWNIDRFPPVHGDEAWILSPGYKLFSQGIFGSDLYSGLLGMETRYFEFMPLMSLLEGASVRLLGVGVWQMRLVAVLLGTFVMFLTFQLGRRLGDPLAALIALLLLLFWRWAPSVDPYLSSGVPLVDLARIARYDILAAALGLAAFSCAVPAREQHGRSHDFLSGFLAGLAGLAHLYGLFWIVVLLLLLVDSPGSAARSRLRRATLVLSGALAAWSIWLSVILVHWSDFVAQFWFFQRDRLTLLDPFFYAENLVKEHSRYRLGLMEPDNWGLSGLWLLLLGVPLAALWAGRRAVRGDQEAQMLLVPVLVLSLLFALLVRPKMFNYLINFVPLFAILLARWMAWLLRSHRRAWRVVAQAALALTVIQGIWGIGRMQAKARQAGSHQEFSAQLRGVLPSSARVMGPTRYWLALSDREYLSWSLPVLLSSPRLDRPMSVEAAMRKVAPQYVVSPLPGGVNPHPDFWRFMARHARLIRQLHGPSGEPLWIYQLDPGDASERSGSSFGSRRR